MITIHFTSAKPRTQPKIGDRRTTKKHGLQIRVVETHGGMWVRSGSRYRFDWMEPAALVGTQWEHILTVQEKLDSMSAAGLLPPVTLSER